MMPPDARGSMDTDDTPPAPAAQADVKRRPEERVAAARPEKPRSRFAFLTELPALILISLVLALLIKTFIFQAFFIPSDSMVPSLTKGDRVLVNKVVYRLHPPRRGDVIVFADPHPLPTANRNHLSAFWHWLTEGLGISTNPEKDFIKRVIALPGETVEVQQGKVLIDGREIADEPYLSPIMDVSDFAPHRVDENELFVMGDNRTMSSDSRASLGDIPYDKVIGRAFVIIWPPSRMGLLRSVDYTFLVGMLVMLRPRHRHMRRSGHVRWSR
jgi:signal peptidase I